MRSEQQEQIRQLMEDQSSEAALPTSYAMLRERDVDQEVQKQPEEPQHTPEQQPSVEQEQEREPEPVPEPQEYAVDATEGIQTAEESSGDGDDSVAVMEPQEEADDGERGEAGWEEMLTQFDEPQVEDHDERDPYAEAMRDMDWKTALQERSHILA